MKKSGVVWWFDRVSEPLVYDKSEVVFKGGAVGPKDEIVFVREVVSISEGSCCQDATGICGCCWTRLLRVLLGAYR